MLFGQKRSLSLPSNTLYGVYCISDVGVPVFSSHPQCAEFQEKK